MSRLYVVDLVLSHRSTRRYYLEDSGHRGFVIGDAKCLQTNTHLECMYMYLYMYLYM